VLLDDQPSDGDRDPLGFTRLASDLAALILASRESTPITIGLQAGWGMGKSTLMRQLRNALEDRDDVKTVWFDAWTAQDGRALEGLLKSVLDELDSSLLRRALRNERLKVLGSATARSAAKWLKVDDVVDAIWQTVKVDPQARNELEELMKDVMKEWTDKRSGLGNRLLVVFVDDLDRCSPLNVFQIFEGVKLHLNADGFVFVIGYDKDIVSDAILREKQYSSATRSQDYLEKIVQIDYPIPAPSREGGLLLLRECFAASGTSELFDVESTELLLERNGRNPRRIKRFINGYILEYQRGPERRAKDAKRLVRWLLLRTYFSDFTALLRNKSVDDPDPVEELFELERVTEVLQKAEPSDPELVEVADIFERRRLAGPSSDHGADLARYVSDVDERVRELVRNRAFRSLIKPLRDSEERRWLDNELEQRPSPTTAMDAPAAEQSDRDLSGLRVLWIDDNPANNARVVKTLRSRRAVVLQATTTDEALLTLKSAPINLVITDIARGTEPDAGFVGLELLRARGFTHPAIIYASRITGARRERALTVDAQLTTSPAELLRLIESIAEAGTRSSPAAGDAAGATR
jgi:CheY-like chemotaxis protein